MHVGHEVGECNRHAAVVKKFTVVDTSGIHTFPVSFCGCVGTPHRRIQLLRVGWMPASVERPKTAFTVDVLDTFQLLTLQSKVSAYDFYYSLAHKTDNTGISKLRVC